MVLSGMPITAPLIHSCPSAPLRAPTLEINSVAHQGNVTHSYIDVTTSFNTVAPGRDTTKATVDLSTIPRSPLSCLRQCVGAEHVAAIRIQRHIRGRQERRRLQQRYGKLPKAIRVSRRRDAEAAGRHDLRLRQERQG
eukprot:gene42510-28941_t